MQTPPAPPTPDHDTEAGVIKDARRRQLRQRQAGVALIATVVVAGGLIAGLGGGGAGSGRGGRLTDRSGGDTPAGGASHLSQAAIRADAVSEARALLASVRVPVGWARVGHVRVQSQGNLGASRHVKVRGNTASITGLWLSPYPMAKTLALLEAHPPVGSSRFSHGWGGSGGQIYEMDTDYRWPVLADKRGVRDVTGFVSVRALKMRNGRAALQVSAQANGLRPRSSSEIVPAGVQAVTVRLQLPPRKIGGHRLGPLLRDVITTPTGIRQAVQIIDSLAITQTSPTKCQAAAGPIGKLTITYSGAASTVLAQATVALPPGWLAGGALAFAPGAGCDPVGFSIRNRAQQPLAGLGDPGLFLPMTKLAGFMPKLLALTPRR